MRYWLLVVGLLTLGAVRAQLSLSVDAGAILPIRVPPRSLATALLPDYRPAGSVSFQRTTGGRQPLPTNFDFTRTRPHLAFFCRLEINEAAGHVIPLKFRLGGHRAWQEDLLRRSPRP